MGTSINVNILNPKAVDLLKNLADLKLISFEEKSKIGFNEVLRKLRSKAGSVPDLDEITKEVEKVRTQRYEK